jgi:hypothetical protein
MFIVPANFNFCGTQGARPTVCTDAMFKILIFEGTEKIKVVIACQVV